MRDATARTPFHLWIIGILAVLWNAMGAFDYTATQMRLDFYMSQFTTEQLEYYYAFPAWVDAAWAIAVWSSLLASLGLLIRQAWAALLFGLAILGLAATSTYTFFLSNGAQLMSGGEKQFMIVVWVIALALYFYSRAMAKNRVLR
jgi:hypothetical protein